MANKTLLLVHGAWHLPAAWDPLLPLLGDFQVETIALPSVAKAPEELCTMYDDAQAVRNAIVKILDNGQDVVVVAHSYGGLPASEACKGLLLAERKAQGESNGIAGIVYLAAMAFPVGFCVWDKAQNPEVKDWWHLSPDQKLSKPEEEGHDLFYNQLSAEEAKRYVEALHVMSVAAWFDKVTYPVFEHAPSAYLICTDDHVIPAEFQRAIVGMSQKPYDLTRELPSDHSPWLGVKHREATAQFIKDAVQIFDEQLAARQG